VLIAEGASSGSLGTFVNRRYRWATGLARWLRHPPSARGPRSQSMQLVA